MSLVLKWFASLKVARFITSHFLAFHLNKIWHLCSCVLEGMYFKILKWVAIHSTLISSRCNSKDALIVKWELNCHVNFLYFKDVKPVLFIFVFFSSCFCFNFSFLFYFAYVWGFVFVFVFQVNIIDEKQILCKKILVFKAPR